MASGLSKAESKDWTAFKNSWEEITRVFGSLLFLPVFVVVGMAYGLREGLAVGLSKMLELFSEWGKRRAG